MQVENCKQSHFVYGSTTNCKSWLGFVIIGNMPCIPKCVCFSGFERMKEWHGDERVKEREGERDGAQEAISEVSMTKSHTGWSISETRSKHMQSKRSESSLSKWCDQHFSHAQWKQMMRTGTWEAFSLEKKKTVNINTVDPERRTWRQPETTLNTHTQT